MNRPVQLEIERLAPTGEGVARLGGKAIFVEGALPGERVAAELFGERSRFARARAVAVEAASADRRPTDDHSAVCGGTDWAHFEPGSARAAKRELFLETMRRIGGIAPDAFGALPISESPLEYRLRSQFHFQGRRVGFFARHSHRIVPIEGCEIVSAPTRTKVAELARVVGGREDFLGTIESVETVETGPDHDIAFWNRTLDAPMGSRPSVEIGWGGVSFTVSARSFFQVNRFRSPRVLAQVENLARQVGGAALDAYSGVGFFTFALANAGIPVTAVEASGSSLSDAETNRQKLVRPELVRLVGSSVEDFLGTSSEQYELVVADPPRAGLGPVSAELALRARHTLLYVSCDPASLARDLRTILPLGFEIDTAILEDFFPLTHRVEALITLRRSR